MDTPVTDQDIISLSALTGLRALNLMSTHVRGLALADLRGLVMLQTLNLENTNLVDEGMAGIAGLIALRSLNVSHTTVTDSALAFLETASGHREGAESRGLKNLLQKIVSSSSGSGGIHV